MQFLELESPFAIYDSGSGYVLPNVLPKLSYEVLRRLKSEAIDDVLSSLLNTGYRPLNPKSSIKDAERVWDFFLHQYLKQPSEDMPSSQVRAGMLEKMLVTPPNQAWKELKASILANIDNLSGWTTSFQRELSQRDGIWRDDDGNYYQRDLDGNVYQVIGAKTFDEARLDFLTGQISISSGTIHDFLQFFSLLAIAYDFVEHKSLYHNSMKAILPERQWPSLNYRWSYLQWIRSRTIVWRPWSNLCDPQWLAGDLLAEITNTLKIPPFEPARIPTGSEGQLSDRYMRQADFALETQLRIGDEEAITLQFGGREFRWINASFESDTRVSVGLQSSDSIPQAEEELNRFLSLLAWEHHVPISRKGGPMVGNRRDLPYIHSGRSVISFKVDPRYPLRTRLSAVGPKEQQALAMYREAISSRSVFYAFLNYWKVVEVIFPVKATRHNWVDSAAGTLTQEQARINDILVSNPLVSEYLDYQGRCAVVHVLRQPFVDPDKSEDLRRITQDLPIARSLAKLAMRSLPAFT